ncbi:somatomedin-B and thrombospondin type-1 domain-containing protein-like [Ornithodoros turicata]|uniref:somatomedin-B and thrombospondin type-1 domain-containing protein-like n=1 Tax=Ornithodoros turicata TaxID=34597 RepID=UPI003139A7B4
MTSVWCALILLWLAVAGSAEDGRRRAGGSCREAGLCCPGRDGSCVVQKTAVNAIVEDLNDKPCFCDHACLQLGDCCYDFKESCGVIDCAMTEWGPWSECDADCGPGVMSRERTILRNPRNGGSPCQELLQKRGCYGSRCDSRPEDKLHRESALLLPVSFSQVRSMNDSYDIRQNLKFLPKSELSKESNGNPKPYLVLFEVSKARKACESLEHFNFLKAGQQVCVSCESTAMRKHLGRCAGHGVDGRASRFAALGHLQCHGRWVRTSRVDRCPHGRQPDFIFV